MGSLRLTGLVGKALVRSFVRNSILPVHLFASTGQLLPVDFIAR